ncbi:MAG: STAS-like domain-containing protein [Candidatus Margulisbacteria bacterium]|jgi:predicted TIM-barrel fold metal-dependent hydrolase|nr:STAS-like domain-containing protein [Candidatus Margulisiibacteriota bacterium]
MKIDVKNFGVILVSRPAGKEAFLSTNAYLLSKLTPQEEIIIDFNGVNVLTPSWADEFITQIKEQYTNNKIVFANDSNPSIKETLAIISSN